DRSGQRVVVQDAEVVDLSGGNRYALHDPSGSLVHHHDLGDCRVTCRAALDVARAADTDVEAIGARREAAHIAADLEATHEYSIAMEKHVARFGVADHQIAVDHAQRMRLRQAGDERLAGHHIAHFTASSRGALVAAMRREVTKHRGQQLAVVKAQRIEVDRIRLTGKSPARHLVESLVQLKDAIELRAGHEQSLPHHEQVVDVVVPVTKLDAPITGLAITADPTGISALQGAHDPARSHHQTGAIHGGQAGYATFAKHEHAAIVGRGDQQLVGKGAHATTSPALANATRFTEHSICMSANPLVDAGRRSP